MTDSGSPNVLPPQAPPPVTVVSSPPVPPPSAPPPLVPEKKPNWLIIAAIAFILLAIVGGLAFLYLTNLNKGPSFSLPSGYRMFCFKEKVTTEDGKYYLETRFISSRENEDIVVMYLDPQVACADPGASPIIKDYQPIRVGSYDGCQLVFLDEKTGREKHKDVQWKAKDYTYHLMSHNLNLTFEDLIKIAKQFP